MKKQILIFIMSLITVLTVFSQSTIPNNVRPATPAFVGWNGTGLNPGFLEVRNDFNFPILFATGTNQNERMRLWQRAFGALMLPGMPTSQQNPYPGTRLTRNAMPVDGLIPIGVPLSLLHLGYQWPVNLQNQGIQGGFRDWMNIGTMYMEGTDNFYVGLREKLAPNLDPTGRTSTVIAGQSDDQDAVIAWGDNTQTALLSPNNLTFIFGSTRSLTLTAYQHTNYGREVMRMIPNGNVGVGPVFFDNAQPQNIFHVNNDLTNAAYIQISNANGTGQTGTDGFHLGITAGTGTTAGIAEVRQFENRDMHFYTNNTFRMVIRDDTTGFGRVGINILTPGNRLTVTSTTADPGLGNVATPGGSSGIRITNLTAATPVTVNPGVGVLTVDSLGDIIYVPADSSGIGFGNLCSDTTNTNPLTGEFRIPTNLFQYKFYGQGLINNTIKQDIVAVGYSCGINPPSRFSVLESQSVQPTPVQTYAGHFQNDNQADPTFILNSYIETAGVYAEAKGIPSAININNINEGGVFEARNAINTIGVVGRTSKSYPNNTSVPSPLGLSPRFAIGGAFMSDTTGNNPLTNFADNYGVYARATNAQQINFGTYTETDGSAITNYALYATAPSNGFSFAGYFSGDVFRTGTDNFSSDAMLKQNFDSIPNALGIISQLQPKKFDYKLTTYPQMNLPSGTQYGITAQNMQQVLPELVNSTTHPATAASNQTYAAVTYSTVEYQQLIPILVKAIQQLSAQNHKQDSIVAALTQSLAAITQSVDACCSNSSARQTGIEGNDPKALTQININLSDVDMIVLNQNVPNPFAEQTTITYNIPEKYGFAQLVFKTVDGRIIKTVDITKKGRGQVNVFANDLSNGLYMYSLIVDGIPIDTKKMVKQN